MRKIFICKVPSLNPRSNLYRTIGINRTLCVPTSSFAEQCRVLNGSWQADSWDLRSFGIDRLSRNVGKKTAILRCVKIPKSSADLIYIAEEAFNHAKLTVVQLVKRLESSSTWHAPYLYHSLQYSPHSGVTEHSRIVECDAVSVEYLPTFRRTVLLSSSEHYVFFSKRRALLT